MATPVNQELFSQASTQVNLLLLSQRNMVLVSAFAITIQTFSTNFKYNYIKYLAILLFIFAIASGSKAVDDFNAYIDDTNKSGQLDDNERSLIVRWNKWSDYSYYMLAIVSFIFLNIIIIELQEFSQIDWSWNKIKKGKKSKKMKIN